MQTVSGCRILALISVLALFGVAAPVSATCPADISQAVLRRVQLVAHVRCPCTPDSSRRDHIRCYRTLANEGVADGSIPRSCRSVVRRLATGSTCGRGADAVTCCRVSSRGQERCTIARSPDRCRPPEGGSASFGVTPYCFDACTAPAGSCENLSLTPEDIQIAADVALNRLVDAGFPVDLNSPGGWDVAVLQVEEELTCSLTDITETQSQLTTESRTTQPICADATDPTGCMGDFDDTEDYCGPGSSVEGDGFVTVGKRSCINPACYCHDVCGREQCTRDSCQFTGTTCDSNFFAACRECASPLRPKSNAICALATSFEARTLLEGNVCTVDHLSICSAEEACCGCQNFDRICSLQCTLTCPVPIEAWGGDAGTADGEFDSPEGIASDSSGNIYVADRDNHRIQKFDANGNLLFAVGYGVEDGVEEPQICNGGCQPGIGGGDAGQLNHPIGIGVDSAGDFYVAEETNNRVSKFDASGNFLLTWGRGVQSGTQESQVCTTGCQQGTRGGDEGAFRAPAGIAVDASGNVYVADSENNRIQQFNTSGNFIRTWGVGVQDGTNEFQVCTSGCEGGTGGGAAGQLNYPYAIALDGATDLLVADVRGNRISRFSTTGNFVRAFGFGVQDGTNELQNCTSACQAGLAGSATGQLDLPQGVAVDPAGNIYVADTSNHRVSKFDANGGFLVTWGHGVQDGADEFQLCAGGCQRGISGNVTGQLEWPIGIAIGVSTNSYVTSNSRVQIFGCP